jgi:hypothetical protein
MSAATDGFSAMMSAFPMRRSARLLHHVREKTQWFDSEFATLRRGNSIA